METVFEERIGTTSNLDLASLLDAVILASPDAVVIIDAHHQIVLTSPAVAAIFQYSPEELVGEPIELLIPTSRRELHADHLRDYFESPHARQMGEGLEPVSYTHLTLP